ncbi:MAG: MFS transporter [Bacillota bacterium]|nr:MFS transporter [Bacillota bacterium]
MEKSIPQQGKPKLWTINFILSCLAHFSIYLVFFSFAPTLPIYIERFGGSSSIAGLAMAALTLAAVFSRPVAGWALDKYGRKLIFLGGLLVFLLPSILYIFMVPVTLLIVLRFIQGLGWGVANTSSWTVASDIVPPERLGEGMGFFSATLSIATAVAPALALWLIGYSFEALFLACSLLIVIAIILALIVKYPQIEKQVVKTKTVFMEKAALRPAMVILFISITYSTILSFIALYAFRQGLASAGLFFAAFAITTLIFRPLSGMIIDRKGEKGYDLVFLIGSIAMITAILVLTRLVTPLHLVVGGIFYGLGFGFIQPTILAQCIRRVPSARRGAANATYWTALDIGVASGSIGWGFVANALGYSMMFFLTLIPVVIAIAIYFTGRKSNAAVPLEE